MTGMIDVNKGKLQDEINTVFEDGTILTASEENLQVYLKALCSDRVPNPDVKHREIIRALTINHIQMQRHIDGLNRKNTLLQKAIISLTVIVLFASFVQIYTTVKYAQKPPLYTTQQVQQKQSGFKAHIPSEVAEDDSFTSSKLPYEKHK